MPVKMKTPLHHRKCIHCDEGWITVPDGAGCIDYDLCNQCNGHGFVDFDKEEMAKHIMNMMVLYKIRSDQLEMLCDFPMHTSEDNHEYKKQLDIYDIQCSSIRQAFEDMGLVCPMETKPLATGGTDA